MSDREVKKSTEVRMLPLECQYLNKAALTTTAGQIPPLARHFQIKRKPKSATLRAEILQKCKSFMKTTVACQKTLQQYKQLFVDFMKYIRNVSNCL